MNLREAELPGIGRKYSLTSRSGDSLVMVVHNDERRDLFHMDGDTGEVLSSVTLDNDEARSVAAILAGITYKPKLLEDREISLEGLVIDWIRIEPGSRCIGKRIHELDLRGQTGASLIAVVEKNKTHLIHPGADYELTAGSTVVAAGERLELKKLKALLATESA